MRRALLAAAIAIPLGVLAVTAGVGQVIETTDFNATAGVSYINAAHCAGTALQVEWTISPAGNNFLQDEKYIVYASNTDPRPGSTFCAVKDDGASVHAGSVGSIAATAALASTTVSAADVATKTTVKCDSTSEGTNVFICAHWVDAAGTTNKGSAIGTFQIQVAKPDAPVGVTAGGGDSKLNVSWTANGATPTRTDHYIARAYISGDSAIVATGTSTGTSATITGLKNDQPYDVDVVAVSVGGNESAASDKVIGVKPIPAADFWDVYKAHGGVETGGCTSGSAGVFALLGIASMLALRRRKS